MSLPSKLGLADMLRAAIALSPSNLTAALGSFSDNSIDTIGAPGRTQEIPFEEALEKQTKALKQKTPSSPDASIIGKNNPVPRRTSSAPLSPDASTGAADYTDAVTEHLLLQRAYRKPLEEWQNGKLPVRFNLTERPQFQPFLTAIAGRKRPTRHIDYKKLIPMLAQYRPVKKLPYRHKRSLVGGVIFLRDASVGMRMFESDSDRLIELTQLAVGRHRVTVLSFMENGRPPPLPRAPNSTVIILSDLQGSAVAAGYTETHETAWQNLIATSKRFGMALVALRPGDLGIDGAGAVVMASALPALFDRASSPIRSVPWDRHAKPSQILRAVRGRPPDTCRPSRRGTWNLTADTPRVLLLKLVSLTHDVDSAGLRVARLALSEPDRLANAVQQTIEIAKSQSLQEIEDYKAGSQNSETKKALGEACKTLNILNNISVECPDDPIAPEASALDELQLWWSPYIQIREATGGLSQKIEDVRKGVQNRKSDRWNQTLALYERAIEQVRAGRGLLQLMGDKHVSHFHGPRRTPSERQAYLTGFAAAARKIEQDDQSTWRLALIAGDEFQNFFQGNPKSADLPDGSALFIYQDANKLRIIISTGQDHESGCLLRVPIPKDAGGIELRWMSAGTASADQSFENFMQVPQNTHSIPLLSNESTYIAIPDDRPPEMLTVLVQIGSLTAAASLGTGADVLTPLFSRTLGRSAAGFLRTAPNQNMRFVGDKLALNAKVYDVIGLKRNGDATPSAKAEVPANWDVIDAATGLKMAHQDNKRLALQTDWDSGAFVGTELAELATPGSASDPINVVFNGPMQGAAAPGGAVLWNGVDSAVLVTDAPQNPTGLAQVDIWTLEPDNPEDEDVQTHQVTIAASAAGAVISVKLNAPESTAIFYLPKNANIGDVAKYAITSEKVRELALSDTGVIAAHSGGRLHLFQSIASIPQTAPSSITGAMGDADQRDLGFAVRKRASRLEDRYQINAQGGGDHEIKKLLAAIVSDEWTALLRTTESLRQVTVTPDAQKITDSGIATGEDAQLVAAVLRQDRSAAISAIEAGANINLELAGSGFNPIYLACLFQPESEAAGNILIKELLARGANPNQTDRFGRTPLYNAGYGGLTGVAITTLLDAGADPALNGRRPAKGNGDVVEVGPLPFTLLHREGQACCPREIILRMLDLGADVNAKMNNENVTSLCAVATRDDPDLFLKILNLQLGWKDAADTAGWTPLTRAIHANKPENVRILLDNEADPNRPRTEEFWTVPPLTTAVVARATECVSLLLEAGAKAHPDDSDDKRVAYPIEQLVYVDDETGADQDETRKIALLLVKHGALLDAAPWPLRSLVGSTPVPRALWVVRALTEAGQSVSLVDTLAEEGRFTDGDWVSEIIEAGIDPSALGAGGTQLLHAMATKYRKKKDKVEENSSETIHLIETRLPTCFETLQSQSANLLAVDDQGHNALHYAAAFGNEAAIDALLDIVPDLKNLKNRAGQNPADVASSTVFDAPKLGVRSPVELPENLRQPYRSDLLKLSFLSPEARWQVIETDDIPVWRSGSEKATFPLQTSPFNWHPVLARRAKLPYLNSILEERWWQRDDGVIGVSGRVYQDGALLFQIEGSSPPIHEMNAKQNPLLETEDQARQYLAFFCHSVHGADGHFALLTDREATRAHLGEFETSVPARGKKWLTGNKTKDGRWRFDAVVRYSSSVFEATFEIQTTGMVEMLNDDPIVALEELKQVFTDDCHIYFYDLKSPKQES